MNWYQKWFNEFYLKVYKHRDDSDAQNAILFLQTYLTNPNCKILDLCCGNGRHSIKLAKLGFSVTGIDLSETLLKEAKKNVQKENLKLDFVRSDAREIPFENEFDFVINLFTSFGYFEETSENLKQLLALSKSLKPDGKFVIDYLNEGFSRKNLVEQDFQTIENIKLIQKRKIENNRIVKTLLLTENGKTHEFVESVRLYSLEEMKNLCGQAGLKILEVFGDFDKSAYDRENSKRMILIGEKMSFN